MHFWVWPNNKSFIPFFNMTQNFGAHNECWWRNMQCLLFVFIFAVSIMIVVVYIRRWMKYRVLRIKLYAESKLTHHPLFWTSSPLEQHIGGKNPQQPAANNNFIRVETKYKGKMQNSYGTARIFAIGVTQSKNLNHWQNVKLPLAEKHLAKHNKKAAKTFVGFPSWSKAFETGGPLTSTSFSACLEQRLSTDIWNEKKLGLCHI